MTECEYGHVFCDSHLSEAKKELSLEEKQEIVLKWLADYGEDDEDILEGCKSGDERWIDSTYENMLEENDDHYNWPKVNCPCCQLDSVTSDDLINYLLFCYNKTKEEVEKEMKEKFGTLDAMNKVLEG